MPDTLSPRARSRTARARAATHNPVRPVRSHRWSALRSPRVSRSGPARRPPFFMRCRVSHGWATLGSNFRDTALAVGRQPDGLADLGDLPGVIVPVEVEERANVLGEGDLLGAHELLEERNPRLARLQLVIGERRDHGEHLAALLIDSVDELLENHPLA